MGGTIAVESQVGHGSTFSFTTRVTRRRGRSETPRDRPNPLQGLDVLIVEDNATNRTILQKQMAKWGTQGNVAETGEDALALLQAAARRGRQYDLALLDMKLPGIDGLELARRIKADPSMASVTLVMLTSMDGRTRERDDAQAEIAATLVKPVPQRDLYACLARLVSSGSHEDRDTGAERATVRDTRHMDRRVLLVEDNRVNQAVARRMLENLGLRVDLAEDGVEAVGAYGHGHYNLILMDGQMPKMDGYEAARQIRLLEAGAATGAAEEDGHPAHVPIVAMTAHAMTGDRDRCLDAGMDDYLSKPFTRPELSEILGRWLPLRADDASRPHRDPSLTLLVVDDEADVLETISQMLEGAGYRVLEARSSIDLVVTDIIMPGYRLQTWPSRASRPAPSVLSSTPNRTPPCPSVSSVGVDDPSRFLQWASTTLPRHSLPLRFLPSGVPPTIGCPPTR